MTTGTIYDAELDALLTFAEISFSDANDPIRLAFNNLGVHSMRRFARMHPNRFKHLTYQKDDKVAPISGCDAEAQVI